MKEGSWQAGVLCWLAIACVILSACGCRNDGKTSGATRIKVAYIGLTCEAPIFVAYENGYFAEEGLEPEMVKTDWDGLREGLGLGRFDANHTLLMYLLKPIEQGLDVKITGGVHTGCLRLHVANNSALRSVKDLKGKKIGVPTHLGSPPHLFAARVLAANGIDPRVDKKDVTWVTFPGDLLGKAIEDGRVDAVATSDPIGTLLVGMGLVRTVADQAEDEPYRDEYCCVSVVSGKLARENPETAAKVTRAIFKAAKWVEENTNAAARMAVEKKYIAASPELNAQALVKLRYVPGVDKCRKSIHEVAKEMIAAGLLPESCNADQLAMRSWQHLDGVTDAWVQSLKMPERQMGARPARLEPAAFAALWNGRCLCCARGCCLD
ncbi:MAG TPA: ABC transporter substrate-binding protein [Gemmataceae bacterium]|nr:ABC transporter substrate-binding protein [Gemmataceae bacterium]